MTEQPEQREHDTANPAACWCHPFQFDSGIWAHQDQRVPIGMAVPVEALQAGANAVDPDDGAATVLTRNTCRHCRRPIAYVVLVGWLHDEDPEHADEPVGCARPEPLDWSCSFCNQPRPTVLGVDGRRRVDAHDRHGQLCLGSRKPAVPPLGEAGKA